MLYLPAFYTMQLVSANLFFFYLCSIYSLANNINFFLNIKFLFNVLRRMKVRLRVLGKCMVQAEGVFFLLMA